MTACLIALRGEFPRDRAGAACDDRWEIVLAEACTNIVEHALPDRPDDEFTLSAWLREDQMFVRLCDHGRPMPDGHPPPARAGLPPADILPEGGFGWSIIHFLCRSVDFARCAGENRLDLVIPVAGAECARK